MKHSYSWSDVEQILEQQLDPDALIAGIRNNQIRAEPALEAMVREKKAIDAACRVFAKRGKWPPVSPLIAYCIYSRVRVARDAVKFLRGRSRQPFLIPSPRCSPSRMLEYLLVDFWRVCGGLQFRYPALNR